MKYKNPNDFIGKKYNKLLAVKFIEKTSNSYFKYEFLCDCGIKKILYRHQVDSNHIKSCGCMYEYTRTHKENQKPRKDIKKGKYTAAFNCMYASYKRNAKVRKIKFELNKGEFYKITQKNCYYCNSKPKQNSKIYQRKNSPVYICNGIDRFDNNVGYNKNNSVPCCCICNRAKGVLKVEEFYSWINRIQTFNLEK